LRRRRRKDEELGKIGGNAEHTPDRLGLLLENTERHLVAYSCAVGSGSDQPRQKGLRVQPPCLRLVREARRRRHGRYADRVFSSSGETAANLPFVFGKVAADVGDAERAEDRSVRLAFE
jgi:hypothetical protein